MHLHYMSRSDYRKKEHPETINRLHDEFGDFYLIPEGGSNTLAVKGCSEIIADIPCEFDFISCACGTGGTLAGLAAGLKEGQQALGFAVLKGAGFLRDRVTELLQQYSGRHYNNWEISLDYHCGGYAKTDPELLQFIRLFERQHHIALEPIYTGKMLYGLYTLIEQGTFPRGTTIVALHSGGLQGV